MEEHTPTVPLDDILAFTDIPPVAHEFAALLQAGTSYELVDWLAKRLQFAAEQLPQEHKDREMIQKALLGALTLEEEEAHEQLEQQQGAKKKVMDIQMSPLNTGLVKVHEELAKCTRFGAR